MKTEFNEQESLQVINSMIQQARNTFQRGYIQIAMLWGYLITAIAITNFILLRVLEEPHNADYVWYATFLGLFGSAWLSYRIEKGPRVKNPVSETIFMAWIGLAAAIVLLFVVLGFISMYPQLGLNNALIRPTPFIMLFLGLAQLVTAKACRYTPYYIGVGVLWLGALACGVTTLKTGDSSYELIILAAAMLVSFVLPNHILLRKNKRDV